MKKVVKFGGSSLAGVEQFEKVADIIHADCDRRFVVPSAPGKRNDSDSKVTDLLYQCYAMAEAGEDFETALAVIRDRYEEIIDGLHLQLSLGDEFQTKERKALCGFPRGIFKRDSAGRLSGFSLCGCGENHPL